MSARLGLLTATIKIVHECQTQVSATSEDYILTYQTLQCQQFHGPGQASRKLVFAKEEIFF